MNLIFSYCVASVAPHTKSYVKHMHHARNQPYIWVNNKPFTSAFFAFENEEHANEMARLLIIKDDADTRNDIEQSAESAELLAQAREACRVHAQTFSRMAWREKGGGV